MSTEEELKEKLFEVMKKYHKVTAELSSIDVRSAHLKYEKSKIENERVSIERSLETYFRNLNEDDHSR